MDLHDDFVRLKIIECAKNVENLISQFMNGIDPGEGNENNLEFFLQVLSLVSCSVFFNLDFGSNKKEKIKFIKDYLYHLKKRLMQDSVINGSS